MAAKNKIIILAAVMILMLNFSLNGAEAIVPFTDLDNVPEKEKIVSLQERGYVAGTGENKFSPNSRITAAESIQFIVNSMGLNLDLVRFFKEPKATDYFTKANNDAWYAKALITASVNGMELDNNMDPDQEWTKEEFTYYLTKTMESHCNLPMLKIKPADIKDEDQVNAEYSGTIQRAIVYGISGLDENGYFFPQDKITRAEAAEQVYNALEYIKTHSASAGDGNNIK